MSARSRSLFQQSAVASGLVTVDEIVEVMGALRAQAEGERPQLVGDDELSAKLVELGRLTRYQAEQLRAGRSKLTLGPYLIIDSIGQGGMGQVFKAEHQVMGRIVAVKVLPRHKTTPDSIANFMREIRAQAQLDHPNLVRAFDAGQDGSVHYLITEYVPGSDLRRLVRRKGRLSMQAAAVLVSQAAQGLGHAHSRGLIHRDVKPGNLLVTPEAVCKVSDLGLAGYFHDEEPRESSTKVVGTADYLSPEQIMTPESLTPASDFYSLGCTLYYAVTGKVPFPGGNAREKARAHCQLPPLDPRRLCPDLADEFVDVIADLMAKNREERLQKAEDVVRRLSKWADGAQAEAAKELSGHADAQASGYVPPGPHRAPPILLKDTEPNFLVQPAEEFAQPDNPSQISQLSQFSVGTQPVAALGEETLPTVYDREAIEEDFVRPVLFALPEMSPLVKALVLVGILTAATALGLVLLQWVF